MWNKYYVAVSSVDSKDLNLDDAVQHVELKNKIVYLKPTLLN